MCLHFNILQIKYIAACLKNVKWEYLYGIVAYYASLTIDKRREQNDLKKSSFG